MPQSAPTPLNRSHQTSPSPLDVKDEGTPQPGPVITASRGPVIIVGGGIGGLAAALALQQLGIEVVVFERDTAPDQVRLLLELAAP